MTEREAQEIVRMIESAWQCDYGQDGRRLWKQMLYDQEPEIGTMAVAKLSEVQRERPRVADLRQMIQKIKADLRAKMPGIPEPKYGTEPPEWVWVWGWCRNLRSPRHYLPFPQQLPYVDETQVISQESYDELRAEWEASGSPKPKLWPDIKAA